MSRRYEARQDDLLVASKLLHSAQFGSVQLTYGSFGHIPDTTRLALDLLDIATRELGREVAGRLNLDERSALELAHAAILDVLQDPARVGLVLDTSGPPPKVVAIKEPERDERGRITRILDLAVPVL